MWTDTYYRNGFGLALLLHVLLALLLITDLALPPAPVSGQASVARMHTESPAQKNMVAEPIEAVHIDAQVLSQKVSQLKEKKEQAHRAAVEQQKALQRAWEQAKQKRVAEERKLAKLKAEAAKKAKEQAQKLQQEQQRLADLARQKADEAKQVAELRKQQEALKQEQAALLKQQQREQAKLAQEQAERTARQRAEQQQIEARRQAQIQSEMDRYKALIINAISQQWILPENIDQTLSSQFQIRLGPDGSVLDVRLVKSSGDALLDRSAQTAIHKASPVPVPSDRELFEQFRDIRLTVRPENIRG
ncbi:MAG: cell envelope integrity protein TolA [Legionellaceae bacterium]|nr:cell envelope integrity protein TolA [Legionellaceae bacterium]